MAPESYGGGRDTEGCRSAGGHTDPLLPASAWALLSGDPSYFLTLIIHTVLSSPAKPSGQELLIHMEHSMIRCSVNICWLKEQMSESVLKH